MLELPADIQECIFSYLDSSSIITCSFVTKRWRYYFLDNDQRLFAPRLGIADAPSVDQETRRYMGCVAPKTSLGFWFNQTFMAEAISCNLNRKDSKFEIKFIRPHQGFPRSFSSIIYRGSSLGQLPDTQYIGPYQFTVRYPPIGYPAMEGVVDVQADRIERHDYPIGPRFSVSPAKTPVVNSIDGYGSLVFDRKLATSISGYQAWVSSTAIALEDNRRYLGIFTRDLKLVGWHKVDLDRLSTTARFVSGDKILAVASDQSLSLIIDGIKMVSMAHNKEGYKIFTTTHFFNFIDGVLECCKIDAVLSTRQLDWATIVDVTSSPSRIFWCQPLQQNVLNDRYLCVRGHKAEFVATYHYLLVIDLVSLEALVYGMYSKRDCFWTMDDQGQVVATSLEVAKNLVSGNAGSAEFDLISMKVKS